MSIGKGSIYSMSTKQKINTKSSTKAKIIGTSDAMNMVMWTQYFLESQRFIVNKNVVYQDNKSVLLLEKNELASSGRRTKHIHIHYFYITNCIKICEVRVEHCPMEEMVADYFTKPLQGLLFREMCLYIMNIPKGLSVETKTPQECVGGAKCGMVSTLQTNNNGTMCNKYIQHSNDANSITIEYL